MRGHASGQAMLFSSVSPEARVPATHPLRGPQGARRSGLEEAFRDLP